MNPAYGIRMPGTFLSGCDADLPVMFIAVFLFDFPAGNEYDLPTERYVRIAK